ncbi:MAG TPA: type II toxin-antitoxin system RelE/ParE family toxin [Spirochaetota bacterium]|nr:type II toxin-antitoxin system RelE/ParE family toxin [Spirochaetota bacterium]HNT11871.1 type II toxin-antitoxin system RelE/ParE family toxin [Spirochaetota bacterium]HOS38190.1 type II toxin-antitoxin system RelE/ParE family toxin [Spirochaetota bacterium]
MRIVVKGKAAKQLCKIEKSNRALAIRIRNKIRRYAADPQGRHDVKPLRSGSVSTRRLRVGVYRVTLVAEEEVLYVLESRHRQGAYRG